MKVQFCPVKTGEERQIVLPSEVCESMSLKICDTIIIRVEDNQAILWSVVRTIERFQSMLAKKVPPAYRC